MSPISNLTIKEEFKLTGNLSYDRTQLLIDIYDKVELQRNAVVYLDTAKQHVPDEDFFDSLIDSATNLRDHTRGKNRIATQMLIDEIEELKKNMQIMMEELTEKLEKAEDCIFTL